MNEILLMYLWGIPLNFILFIIITYVMRTPLQKKLFEIGIYGINYKKIIIQSIFWPWGIVILFVYFLLRGVYYATSK